LQFDDLVSHFIRCFEEKPKYNFYGVWKVIYQRKIPSENGTNSNEIENIQDIYQGQKIYDSNILGN